MLYLQNFVVVIGAYVLAHGLTAALITPLQSYFLPEVTAFASLVYLPHGVRVLATWLLGPKAMIPLGIGAFLSEVIFTPAEVSSATDPLILLSIVVGASSAFLAFEMLKIFRQNLYGGRTFRVHWSGLLLVGILASVVNSIGQAIVFSEAILPGLSAAVLATYAVGDLFGLIAMTLALMLVFRWIRLSPTRG